MSAQKKFASNIDISSLVTKANQQAVANEDQLYSFFVQYALDTVGLRALLKTSDVIDNDLSAVANIARISHNAANRKPYIRQKIIEPSERFYVLYDVQKRLLSNRYDKGCALLLAALKILDELGSKMSYKATMQDILSNNIHKLEISPLESQVFGRQHELADILRAIDVSFQGSILITGPSGSGKTLLAHAAIRASGVNAYRIYPGGAGFFDHIVNLMVASEDDNLVLFMDNIAGYDPEHIRYALEHSKIIVTADDAVFKKFVAEQPGLAPKFKVIKLQEMSELDTKDVLASHLVRLSASHGLSWEDGFADNAYGLSKRYVPGRAFPAKAIELVQEAALFAGKAADKHIDKAVVRTIISRRLGMPMGDITESEKNDLSSLPDRLRQRVKGQDEAVLKVARVIQRSRLGFGKKNRPVGSFLFVGPSGVGKTELAKAVAHAMFGDEEAMVRLDMSEFSEAHNVQRLVGAPPGYVGYEEGGQLTNPVKAKPYNVVLLDEIEKANPRVFDIFLQVLDDGRLTDGQGSTVDFRDTLVIATSNAGIEDILDLIEEGKTTAEIEPEIKDILQDYFRIEFINRFDAVVLFNTLVPTALGEIARLQLEKLAIELAKRDIELMVSDDSIKAIAEVSYDPRYGARGLLRYLQDNVENRIVEMIISGELAEGQQVTL